MPEYIYYQFYGLLFVSYTLGGVLLFTYSFPKVRNADELHTLLSPKEWTPGNSDKLQRMISSPGWG